MHNVTMSDAPEGGPRDPADRVAGLCAACRHMRVIVSSKGSRFYMCTRAAHDPAYRRYPPIPVRHCAGFDPSDAGPSSVRPASEST